MHSMQPNNYYAVSVQRITTNLGGFRSQRGSQIPVRTDRYHPHNAPRSTTHQLNHYDDSKHRRNSVNVLAAAMLDWPRDPQVDDESRQKSLSPPDTFRRRSLTDDQQQARTRALARLARSSRPPELPEVTSSAVGQRRPHKLDPISPPNNGVDLPCLEKQSDMADNTVTMTSPEIDTGDVTCGVGGGVSRREGGRNCKMRPTVSRKAKAIMMM